MQIVVDGLLTHYQSIGDKPKKLLILPGWMHTSDAWLSIAKALSEKYAVVILDLPGFGKTQKPDTTYSIYDYATFVQHFLDKIEAKHVTLLGHSFGGRLGIILAAKTDYVTNLVLVDAAGVEKRSTGAKIKIMFFKFIKIFLPKHTVEKLRGNVGSQDYKTSGEMREIFIKVINEDLTYLLSEIVTPTLLIWGNNDMEVPEWKTKLMKKSIPRVKLRVVWGSGHNPQSEKPKEFMEILTEYLT